MRRAESAVQLLSGLGAVRAAFLFGSHVGGQPDRWSDIDVAVFMDEVGNWDIERRAQVMALVMREVGYDVETHLFPTQVLAAPCRGSFAAYVTQHGVPIALNG